jgi:hypothetical protein
MNIKQLVALYNSQTPQMMDSFGPNYGQAYRNLSGGDPVLFNQFTSSTSGSPALAGFETKHDSGISGTHDLARWDVAGGLFADCCLENPVVSLLNRPTQSLGSLVPVMNSNNDIIKNAYLAGDYDVVGDWASMTGKCDTGPSAGTFTDLYAEFRKGRLSFSSRTAELDELIKSACSGINFQNFYFINRNRGVSGSFPAPFQAEQRDEIFTSAIYRELHAIAVAMQQKLLTQFWYGDGATTAGAGAYLEFYGLDLMITDQYGTAATPWVTGTGDDTLLNSDVKVHNANAGEADASGYSLLQKMSEIAFEIDNRSRYYGVQADHAWVMSSFAWKGLVDTLPCEMVNDTCVSGNTVGDTTNVTVNASTAEIAAARRELLATQRITLNGKSYPVIVDDFITVTETDLTATTGGYQYASDIYFVPLRVNGQSSMQWVAADYRAVEQQLAGIPTGMANELRGWSDDGRFHTVLQRDLRCFIVDVKTEMGLMFLWPHLAGRVNGVYWTATQTHTLPAISA